MDRRYLREPTVLLRTLCARRTHRAVNHRYRRSDCSRRRRRDPTGKALRGKARNQPTPPLRRPQRQEGPRRRAEEQILPTQPRVRPRGAEEKEQLPRAQREQA